MAQNRVRDAAREIVLAAALLSFFLTDPLAAQSQANGQGDAETVDLIALRLESGAAIDVDGRLDEEAWERAIPITDFTQQEPVEGGTPSERTEIRVIYDEDALYIGAILYDDPEGIVVFQNGGMASSAPTTDSCGFSTPSGTVAPATSSRPTPPA